MDLKDAINAHHHELHTMLKESGSKTLEGMTIISVNDKPSGQMVIAPPDWSDQKIAERLQACVDGIKDRTVHERG